MHIRRHARRLVLWGVLALGLLAAPLATATNAPTNLFIFGGGTTVTLDPGTAGALRSLGVAVAPSGAAAAGKGGVTFPITVGEVALDGTAPVGEIRHLGGLQLTAGSTSLVISRFTINLDDAVISARATLNGKFLGRVDVFSVAPTSLDTGSRLRVGAKLALTGAGADALNQAFGVTSFTEGLSIGTAQVNGRILFRGEW